MGFFTSLVSVAFATAVFAAPAPQAAGSAARFTYYNLKTPVAGPCDLYTGPDGNIYASTFLADKLVKITRTSANPALTEITIPYTRDKLPTSVLPQRLQGAGSCVIQPGYDGNVYIATGIRNQIARYNPRNGKFAFFDTAGGALGNLQPFNDGWPSKKGMYFTQTTANTLTLLSYSGKMSVYTVPTPNANPIGVIVVPSGDVWICEFLGQKMAKFNPSTEKFTEYPVPLTLLGPAVVRAFTNNKYIWFTAIATNAIGRLDITTGAMKAYSITLSGNLGIPIEDTNDSRGNIWFSTALSNTLNYLKPSTGAFTRIAQPDGGIVTDPVSIPPLADIAMHWVSQDNSMWFTELAGNRIGRYQLTGKE